MKVLTERIQVKIYDLENHTQGERLPKATIETVQISETFLGFFKAQKMRFNFLSKPVVLDILQAAM